VSGVHCTVVIFSIPPVFCWSFITVEVNREVINTSTRACAVFGTANLPFKTCVLQRNLG
jgi:hypothetical protein